MGIPSSEIQNEVSYMNPAANPNRISIDTMYFYSAPSSPSKLISRPYETAPSTPKSYADSDSSSSEFEFAASRRFTNEEHNFDTEFATEKNFEYLSDQDLKPQRQHGDSLPPMAFADDLFSDGKVLPLKLPPRLHTVNGNISPTLSSPRSPGSALKLSFASWSSWKDDFDPFMVAMENVTDDDSGRGKSHSRNFHRRARSLSPLRSINPERPKPNNEMGRSGPISNQPVALIPIQSNEPHKIGPQKRTIQIGESPIRLAEPRGLAVARKMRLVKMGHESPKKPNVVANPRPIADSMKESKTQKTKKFLFWKSTVEKEVGREEPNGEMWPKLMRRLSFRARNAAQINGDKRLARVNRATVVQYRPRLFLCLGYGSRGLTYVK